MFNAKQCFKNVNFNESECESWRKACVSAILSRATDIADSLLHDTFDAALPFKKNPACYNRPCIKDTHDFSMLAYTKEASGQEEYKYSRS
jgi:hypothetical protein